MLQKLYIETHGCQMNEYDSASIQNLLSHSHRLVLTQDPNEADVIVLNTPVFFYAAHRYQQATDWHKKIPENFNL